jgi:hypothetical protein
MASLQTSLQTLIRTPMLDASGLITREWTLFMQQLIKSLNVTDDLQAQVGYILDPAAIPAFRSFAYQGTANQALTNGAFTNLTFDTNFFDVGGIHSTTVNPTRFTVPLAGIWLAASQLQTASNAAGKMLLGVNVNGNAIIPAVQSSVNQVAGSQLSVQVSGLLKLNVGDYVEYSELETLANTTTLINGTWGSLIFLGS